MSTRAIVRIIDEEEPLVNIYRSIDGHPDTFGTQLFKFLDGLEIVSGFSIGASNARSVNGAPDLAALLVKELKEGPGGLYIYPPTNNDLGQEFEYHILVMGHEILVRAFDYNGGGMFRGTVEEFGEYCRTYLVS